MKTCDESSSLIKPKYIATRVAQCKILRKQSSCPRRKIAAVLIDPETNTVVADGYNGPPRGGDSLCGGTQCLRDSCNITSGTSLEVGCHHAEMNCILNAARIGNKTSGRVMIVTAEPCMMCAKAIHHAGISQVIVVEGGYAGAASNGIKYLESHGVSVTYWEQTLF